MDPAQLDLADSPALRYARLSLDASPTSPSSSAFSLASLSQSLVSSASSVSDDHSLLFSPSASASPVSSLAPSPSLEAKRAFYPSPPELSLAGTARPPPIAGPSKPNPTQLAQYASSIIRNEAYALLALAARLAPAAHPLVYDDEPYGGYSPPASGLSSEEGSVVGGEVPEEQAPMEGVPSSPEPASGWEESKTNVAFRHVVDLVSSMPAHGKILVTGVGKSGIVGRKMVATFCSLGIQAVFLHPLEALHGDLGVVCSCTPSHPCDTLLMISHSGATAELMRLLPIVRPRVRSLVAVTRDPESVLAKSCHGWLDAGTGVYPEGLPKGTTDEADSALPAPTNSVVTALAIGDALALTLSRLKIGWDKDGKDRRAEFFHCHPGGQLGIQLGREGRGVDIPSSAAIAKSP
ncbi:hypothetical protein JCM10207_004980 [Rhodosporidiobolus poonsookiae]